MKVAAALAQARAEGIERLDAQLLLAHILGRDRAWLLAHADAPLDAAAAAAYADGCARLRDDQPLAYLTGAREFHGLRLAVGPAVLVPRPDTETLVDWALELLGGPLAPLAQPGVADLGTGSGAIALAVKHRCPRARVTAVERSAAALAIARANSERLGLAVDWRAGDWWQPLAGQRFDLVLSNPPYVAPGDPHLHALRHEPHDALVPPGHALAAFEAIVGGAGPHLAPGGRLLLEHGFDQAEAVQRLLREAGFEAVEGRTDLGGRPRCSGGRRP